MTNVRFKQFSNRVKWQAPRGASKKFEAKLPIAAKFEPKKRSSDTEWVIGFIEGPEPQPGATNYIASKKAKP